MVYFVYFTASAWAGIAQSIQQLIMSWMVWGSNPGGRGGFPNQSIPALGPPQPPIQWVPVLSRGYRGPGMALTTYPHLVPRSKKDQNYTSAPNLSLCGLFYGEMTFTFTGSAHRFMLVSCEQVSDHLINESGKYHLHYLSFRLKTK